ncbi:hypothetical protein Caci_6697 [Catenulispora acidiphila DSM 44928]|uniref:Uncharacterized protein n=1 Tax=Catenulispora acidiphila (strain DSM 44928 / JCM 14897 / NBRC 102108 / NRRL B-24433 / ID139908) TaxID=479433 RepID=C7Q050_CATAD|nr:hypothetical protein [Catenulispora acidiphila]ACU75543.1 hypothetical protein Caci_6697 [Catenulispora acidiphila DSM 44928]
MEPGREHIDDYDQAEAAARVAEAQRLIADYQDTFKGTYSDLLTAFSQEMPDPMLQRHLLPPPALRARPTIDDYDHDLERLGHPAHDAFGHLRDLVLIGLRVGTISVEDLYSRVRPALVALTVLLDAGTGDAASALARRIRHGAGRGVADWTEAVVTVDAWPGSIRSLLKQQPQPGDDIPVHALLGLDEHLWRGANILLALAPPETLPHIAADAAPMGATGAIVGEPHAVRNARALVRIAGHAPLSRPVVDYALRPQTSARVRMALAGNPLTPNAVLVRLLTYAGREPGVAAAISLHECTSPAVRLAAYREVRDPAVREQAREALQRDAEVVRQVQLIASLTAKDVPLMHVLIRDADPELPIAARLFAYAHVARMSGIEVVWTLEMERAGALEAMHPAVRASMESGSVVPLLEAAVADPYRGVDQDAVTSVAMLRREEALDRPFPWQEAVGNQPR